MPKAKAKPSSSSISIRCPACESDAVVGDGYRYNMVMPKQLYRCNTCGVRFTIPSKYPKAKFDPIIRDYVIVRYYQKPPFQELVKEVREKFKIKVSKVTIRDWVQHAPDRKRENSYHLGLTRKAHNVRENLKNPPITTGIWMRFDRIQHLLKKRYTEVFLVLLSSKNILTIDQITRKYNTTHYLTISRKVMLELLEALEDAGLVSHEVHNFKPPKRGRFATWYIAPIHLE